MSTAVNNITNLVTQLPMLLIYLMGVLTAWQQRSSHPQSAKRALFAFLLLIFHLLVLVPLGIWLLNAMLANGIDGAGNVPFWVAGIGLLRSLVYAFAIWLLIGALFPRSATQAAASGLPGWVWRLGGALLGLLLGGVLAVVTGDWIGQAMQISQFEGGRGYFVAFILIPLFSLIGAVLGALLIRR